MPEGVDVIEAQDIPKPAESKRVFNPFPEERRFNLSSEERMQRWIKDRQESNKLAQTLALSSKKKK